MYYSLLHESAVRYALLGFAVFPCNLDKSPLTRHGHHHATTNLREIDYWWHCYPWASIGVACKGSGLVGIDVDDHKHTNGFGPFDEVEEKYGELPLTPTVLSGGGGKHYWMKDPGDVKFRGEICPGIDIKWDGYLIAPPSPHPSGQRYEWVDSLSYMDLDVADIPLGWTDVLLSSISNTYSLNSSSSYNHTTCGRQTYKNESLTGWQERDLDQQDWLSYLSPDHHNYLREQPARGWSNGTTANGKPRTRSNWEASITTRFVYHGASDNQIIDLANIYYPRQIEEYPRRGNDYIQRTINSMRDYEYSKGWITSPIGGSPRKLEAQHRWTTEDDLSSILSLVDGQRVPEWIQTIQEQQNCSQKTAYNIRKQLLSQGHIRIENKRVYA